MSGRPIMSLHEPPSPQIKDWLARIEDADSAEIDAVIREARGAGLLDALIDAQRVERENTEALIKLLRPVMQGHPDMTMAEAFQKLGYLKPN
jgi:hypothetical protein